MKIATKYSFFLMLIVSTPLFCAEQMEITKVSNQADSIRPTFVQKISNLATAKQWVQQKANCLLFESEECTKTDLLATNYALGFIIGAHFGTQYIAHALFNYGKVRNSTVLQLSQLVGELILGAVGIKGAALLPFLNKISNEITTALLVIADVAGIAQYTAKETPSPLFFLKILGRYLAMNAKCIWSESYCAQSLFKYEGGLAISPFGRRMALFYWLGFASGVAARMIPFRKLTGAASQAISTAKEKLKPLTIPTFVPVPEYF